MQTWSRRNLVATVSLAGAGLLGACSAPAASPTPSAAKPAATAAPAKPTAPPAAQPSAPKPAEPQAKPATPAAQKAPSTPKSPVKIKMLQVSHGLSFAPTYLAQGNGYFTDEAIELEFQVVGGENVAQPALIAGETETIVTSSSGMANMVSQNLPALAVQGTVSALTMHLTMKKGFLQEKGVAPNAPFRERLATLKGTKIGAGTAGSAVHRYLDFLVQQGGMQLDRDVTPVFLPGPPPMMAALTAGQIDGFLLSPPTGEQMVAEGVGEVIFRAPEGDVPQFKTFVHEVVAVRKDYAEKNPEVVERVVRAVSRGNNFLIDKPEDSKLVLQKFFDNIKPDVMSSSVDAIKPAISKDGLMSEAQWKNVVDILVASGAIKSPLDYKEGEFWTNRYIKDVVRS